MQFVDPHLYRRIEGWHSPRLGMHMPIVTYGHAGRPLLLFPTAQADFLEYERFFMIKVLEPFLFAGRVRVYSIDSINKHAWMNRNVPVPEQARRQALYAAYVEEEVAPYIRYHSNDQRIATTGASWGAFHAANTLFRRPDLFGTVIAMSGFYDLEPTYTKGYTDDNVYFNNPVAYLSNQHDHNTLEALRSCQIHILAGQGDYELPNRSEQLSKVLWDKAVPNNLDIWGHDVNHDWPWWRKMLPYYVGERLGW